MGEVYKARDKRLNRVVALKILPPPFGHEEALTARFLGEAQALVSLNHPHIVTVHDLGESEGLCCFVMEFIDGTDLKRGSSTRARSLRRRRWRSCRKSVTLQYAHNEGVVHRDIRRANSCPRDDDAVLRDWTWAEVVDRWSVTLTGPRGKQPHLAWEIIATAEKQPAQTLVRVSGGRVSQDSPEHQSAQTSLEKLAQRLGHVASATAR